jgi:hypothetical protein
MRTARGNGGNGSAALSLVTSDPTQAGQTTTTNIGTFVVPSTGNWQSYAWTPLTSAGVLQPVTLGGVQTLRFTTADGYNVNYYAFFPANTNLPSIQNVYPNGAKLFQPTNVLGFVASSTVGIDPSGINVDLYATNLIGGVSITNYTAANGLTIGGTTGNRTVTLPLQTNILFYRAVIHVTDQTANTADATVNFNTLNPAYAIEAEDFDYNNGLFHDNPQTNAYAGSAGVQGVDSYHAVNPPNGPPNGPYRTDGYNNENCGDNVRDQYDGTGFSDYNLGWNEGGFWANYTRNYPAGTYNVFMRGGNGTGGNGIATLALVTSGVGTPTQTTTNIGTFVIPQTGGWQTYTWAPLKDSGGNLAQVTGGALKTFRVTAGGGYNPNFYAFFPADTSLPTITGLYPSGTSPFQHTNTLRFTASSTAGIAQNNIVVIVDGAPVSGLTFSGSATSWNVTYPNLAVNSAHMVTIMVTANNSAVQSTTVKFDTFKSTYYQFEAEDYDYDGGSFIDNPQTNAYSGLSAVADVDFHDVATGGGYDYRPAGTATEGISDIPRDKFAAATDYNIGFFENGEWGNYTRNYPAGTYHIWARIASGNGSPTTADLSRVTDGWGTDSQSTSYLGRFLVPSDGWGNFNWVRLNNTNHNQAVVLELNGSTNTLRLSRAPGTGGANANFIMLVPVLAPITVNAAKVGGNIQISFPTQAGFSYQAQYKNSLTDVSWTNLGGAISGNNTAQSVNDSTSGANRFYRVQVTEP